LELGVYSPFVLAFNFEPVRDMSATQPLQFTVAQVLCGLKEMWPCISGGDGFFSAETRIDENLKAHGMWDELDFADVIDELEQHFGFHCSIDDWKGFFRFDVEPVTFETEIGPRLTFGALAQFIADRAPAVSIGAVTVLGNPCRPAGAFLGIQKIASQVKPRIEPFAPSTQIRDRLRGGALKSFWERLRWIAENRIPALSPSWSRTRERVAVIGVMVFIAGLFATWALSSSFYVVAGLLIALVLWAAGVIYMHVVNPLPKGVETFGDIARLVANECHVPVA
jgi:hypothetical protein